MKDREFDFDSITPDLMVMYIRECGTKMSTVLRGPWSHKISDFLGGLSFVMH